MTRRTNILCFALAFIAFCFISAGYAAVTDNLNIHGSVDVAPPVYDTLVITDVTTVNNSTVNSEKSYQVIPTNVKTTLNGNKGQSAVYRITVHNYSETETFIYNGIRYDDAFSETINKLNISVSLDANSVNTLSTSSQGSVVNGTAIEPGREFVFYVKYSLKDNVNSEQFLIHYVFDTVKYSVTYLNNNEVWVIDYVVNNDEVYYVRDEGPTDVAGDGMVFADWVNANAHAVDSYPIGNTNNYTLSAKWDNLYLIMFVDEKGDMLYQEIFTSSSTALSAEGQRIVDAKLAELQVIAAVDDMDVAWSSYTIKGAKSDIVVRPVYTYTGNLRFTPIDKDDDGIIDYYQVDAVSKLNNPTKIPGKHMGLPVQTINKLYLNDNNYDYGAGVSTIEIGEGVTTLNHNSLAFTEDLTLVKLPSTMTYIGKNAFSRNWGSDKKKLTIEFNGTMAEWKAVSKDGDWHNGLKTGSRVNCSDGYFELDRGFLELGGYNWKEKKY